MVKHVLLVEIGIEELPSKMVYKCCELFAKEIKSKFKIMNIIYDNIFCFASSRRLAIKVVNIVFDFYIDSNFINKSDKLSIVQCGSDEVVDKHLLFKENIVLLLSNIVSDVLLKFPVSMMMRWGERDKKFIRPVRTISVLLNDLVVMCNVFGVFSDRVIRGHRFMGDKEISLGHAEQYEEVLLKQGYVIVDYEKRKSIIRSGIDDIAKKVGGIVDYTGDLLEEVTGLSEWPVVLFGSFNESFLDIPHEILLYVMKVQKKYFPLYDLKGNLLPYFIFIIDIITKNFKRIITDHEKFLCLSFSDAKFFLEYDSKYLLEEYISRLHTVLFHRKLGNLYEKSIRVKHLSSWVASKIGVDVYQVERASMLSKCDLLSSMVVEFPFAQGIIGMYYAIRDGESQEVAIAQKEQYQPRFSSDFLPSIPVSCVISVVDKIDTITGMFIIGEFPKGNRDPMGLRRGAIGVIRIIIENKMKIDLWSLVERSLSLYEGFLVDGIAKKIIDFIYKRLCFLYEKKGYTTNVIRATLSENLCDLEDFDNRVKAVSAFCSSKESQLLILMYKRVFNILKSTPLNFLKYKFSSSLLVQDEEVCLYNQILILCQKLECLCEMNRYFDALNLLIDLYVPLDKFFRNVVVLSDNQDLQLNRLSLLNKIWLLLLKIIKSPSYILGESSHIR